MRIKLRDMSFSASAVRDIKHVALVPEVSKALVSWIRGRIGDTAPGVLIGGLALSFYTRPRETTDIDLLFLRDSDVPDSVPGFKKHRPRAFEDRQTHVEVEVVTPTSINVPTDVVRMVFETAIQHEGLKVASLEGMIALKLYGSDSRKREYKDMADIVAMLENHPAVSLVGWKLTIEHQARLDDARARAKS